MLVEAGVVELFHPSLGPSPALLETASHPSDPFLGSSACSPEWLSEGQLSSALKFQPHKP